MGGGGGSLRLRRPPRAISRWRAPHVLVGALRVGLGVLAGSEALGGVVVVQAAVQYQLHLRAREPETTSRAARKGLARAGSFAPWTHRALDVAARETKSFFLRARGRRGVCACSVSPASWPRDCRSQRRAPRHRDCNRTPRSPTRRPLRDPCRDLLTLFGFDKSARDEIEPPAHLPPYPKPLERVFDLEVHTSSARAEAQGRRAVAV